MAETLEHTREIEQLQRRAIIDISSYNAEERTFDAVFATESPVLMRTWDGAYNEVLRMSGLRTERLDKGVSLLDNHKAYGSVTENVLGIQIDYRVEQGRAVATIKLSQRAVDRGVGQDIADGILRNISCGYRVYKYEEMPRAEGEDISTYIATDWECTEISLVSIPADPNAQVRSEQKKNNVIITTHTANRMDKSENKAPETIATPEAQETSVRNAQPVDVEALTEKAIEQERQRSLDIESAVKTAGLPVDFARKLIADGVSIDKARAAIIDEWAKNDPKPAAQVKVEKDGQEKIRAAITDGLLSKVHQAPEKPAEGYEDFRSMSLLRIATTYMESQGVSTRGMSNEAIAKAALNPRSRGLHTISDFPIILGDTINRTLRREYELQSRTFLSWTNREDQPDFRGVTRTQLSNLVGNFDEVPEGGEYKAGSFDESAESYKVAKYGQIILLSWEALINDDLSAFSRLPRAIAQKASLKQSQLVYGVLSDNEAMSDGNALFSAAHGNLAASGSAITITSLGAAREAMRKQTAPGDAEAFLNLTPAYLVCGPSNETVAQQILRSTTVPNTTNEANVFQNSMDLVVDPRITGNEWYVMASPMAIDTIEYGFLQGEPELYTEQFMGEDIDSLKLKARMVFGTKAIDWRGMYKNPGA